MNIKSFSKLKYNRISKRYNLFYPKLVYNFGSLKRYEVQEDEEMRMDLVMKSMYSYDYSIEDMDVILFINGIDNPLNIKRGDFIYYPSSYEQLESYRGELSDKSKSGEDVRKALSSPNKATKVDPNRKKFLDNGYYLPPVVTDSEKAPIRLEGDKIVIGGIN